MRIEDTYKVILYKGNESLVQYIAANDADEAIRIACWTTYARVYDIYEYTSVLVQKACEHSIITHPLKFEGGGACVTIKACCKTVFDMFDLAKKHKYLKNKTVEEVYFYTEKKIS